MLTEKPVPLFAMWTLIMNTACFILLLQKTQIKCSRNFKTKRLHFRFASKGFTEVELVLNLKNEE